MTFKALLRKSSLNPAKRPTNALADRRRAYVQCTAELAECTCPEFCERDHGNE